MEAFTDYYAVLHIEPTANSDTIKKAFRVLARQYHPDINADPQANAIFIQARQAYTTLIDAEKRKDFDLQWAQHRTGSPSALMPIWEEDALSHAQSGLREVYSIYNLQNGQPAHFILNGVAYDLTPDEVHLLWKDGVLLREGPPEELLMYCVHCHAIFKSTVVRDARGHAYKPYSLFPLCPHCGAIDWCPADEAREKKESVVGLVEDDYVEEARVRMSLLQSEFRYVTPHEGLEYVATQARRHPGRKVYSEQAHIRRE